MSARRGNGATYALSLHDALPICGAGQPAVGAPVVPGQPDVACARGQVEPECPQRSEEHTSELQSLTNLVCRLRLEKKKSRRRSRLPMDRPGVACKAAPASTRQRW